jgi:hypothetical protein
MVSFPSHRNIAIIYCQNSYLLHNFVCENVKFGGDLTWVTPCVTNDTRRSTRTDSDKVFAKETL